jgi:multidrug efflux pump subunit AcrA (membrane-fusion protein)
MSTNGAIWTSRAAFVIALVALAIAGAAVLRVDTPAPSIVHTEPSALEARVEVVRQDIAPVSVLSATAASSPSFSVAAPVSGVIAQQATGVVASGETIARIGDSVVPAPIDAQIVKWYVGEGSEVRAGTALVEMRFVGIGLVANVTPSDTYRLHATTLTAEGSIPDGPAGFACVPLWGAHTAEPGAVIVCPVIEDVLLFEGLPADLVVKASAAEQVLALPVTAVLGTADQGAVWKVTPNGRITRVSVGLGATDGAMIEIVSGLEEGDIVLRDGPMLGER